jgi:cytochrome c
MFDTMTATKAVAGTLGALLAFLLLNWASDGLYSMSAGGHGGHGEEVAQAYVIDTGAAAGGAEEPAADGPDFATLYAAADAAAGEKVFGKCKACHKLDGKDGTGPHLNGVVGRAKAAAAGFGYSDGLVAMADQTWTPENLDAFLANPKGYVPGTKMSFAGLPKPEDRANLIAFMATKP